MIAVTLVDEPVAVSLVLAEDVATDLRTGDAEARRLVLVACEALVDALIATYASSRHEMN